MKINFKSFFPFWMLLFIPLAIYLAFGIFHLTDFVTADEHFWFYDRTPQYWNALLSGNWAKTRINDKPGITVALISGAGMLWEKNPIQYSIKETEPANPVRPENTVRMGKLFRLPILLFVGLFSFYFFWIIKRMTNNKWLGLSATSLIILSPTLLGISQIANPDSFLWLFSAATIFSFITFLTTEEKKFIPLSALFLALSLLSKYSATILYPFLFALILIYFFTKKKEDSQSINYAQKIKLYFSGYLLIIPSSLVIYALLMPASILKTKYLFQGTIAYPGMLPLIIPIVSLSLLLLAEAIFWKSRITSRIFQFIERYKKFILAGIYSLLILIVTTLIASGLIQNDFLKIWDIPFDVRQGKAFIKGTSLLQKIFLEFRQLVFSLSPLVLISLLWVWFRGAKQKIENNFVVLSLSLFILIFYAAVISQGLLANIRYSIMLYPLAIVLGTIGIFDFFHNFKKNIHPSLILLGILFISTFSLWSIKPFYFNYTSSLLPKNRIVTGAWGYGGFEAAQYINNLPDSEKLNVWADYPGACEFIKGSCMAKKYTYDQTKNKFDYFIFSRRGQILDKKKKGSFAKPIEAKPVFELYIGDRPENFIKVFKSTEN